MKKLSLSQTGNVASNEFPLNSSDSKLILAQSVASEVSAQYRKAPTAYRRALLKEAGSHPLLGLSDDECLAAIDREAPAESGPALRRTIKKAIWRIFNLKEAAYVFDLFKHNTSGALRHIRQQFAGEYKRTAAYVLGHNGYDLTAQDYACTLWIFLSARGTWKAFDSYKGDSSVYAWLKEVCKHCITDYVTRCGYYSLISTQDDGADALDTEGDKDGMGESAFAVHRRGQKNIVHFEDAECMHIADRRCTYEHDFVVDDPCFLRKRINEMPWDEWEKDFMIDSVLNEMSVVELTEKYGGMAALLNGHSEPYSRTWTDNRNSRMKRDLYSYALAFMHDDYDTLKVYADKCKARAAKCKSRVAV